MICFFDIICEYKILDYGGVVFLVIRWIVLCMDFNYVLLLYLNRRFFYLKSVRFCVNMMVKNIFISDNLYELGKFLKNLMIIKCFESGNMYIFTVL